MEYKCRNSFGRLRSYFVVGRSELVLWKYELAVVSSEL